MKTVLISGANGNLGTAVVLSLLQNGYKVIALVLNEDMKRSFISHINLRTEVLDLTNETATSQFIQELIEKDGPVSAALLLVGGFAMGGVSNTSAADIQHQINLNFFTAYHLARPLFSHFKSQSYGRLVFIGAKPAIECEGGKDMVAYGLAKSLLFKLAEYLNEESRQQNITTSVVVPSVLDTIVNRRSMPDKDPSNWVKPEELAEILSFLLSEQANTLRSPIFKVYNNV